MQTSMFTDLAVEAAARAPAGAAGVESSTTKQGALNVIRLRVTSQAGEAALGRPQGRYYTVEIPASLGQGDDDYEQAAGTLAELLKEMLPQEKGCLLVAGLGNEGVTPDALGPETASRVLVTRHLTTSDSMLAELFRAVAVVRPGVLGQTGLESTELLRGAPLKIETLPAVTHCEGCGENYPTVRHGRTCPYCGSEKTWLLRGNEISIKEIEAI